ncbi:MAG: glycosyltransferase [Balneolaceae bacterium]|nr:MAG: glycosyltransferase [Balneolaceae bacterium]
MKPAFHPLISIIIPVYNAEKYLSEAVDSILSQNYKKIEVILVDDGSKDKSVDIINKYVQYHKKIISIAHDNSGPSAARNNGIKLASGEYITFLDSDDFWSASCLQTQIMFLRRNPDCKIIWGKTQFFKDNESKKYENIGEPLHFLNVGSALFHKTLFDTVGLFDENLGFSEDLDWFSRAREAGEIIVKQPHTVLYYRSHETNMTKNKGIQELDLIKVLKKSLDRRRAFPDTDIELPEIGTTI